jgi:hypothetical protein
MDAHVRPQDTIANQLWAFFLRREAVERGDAHFVARTLIEKGFDPLLSLPVDPAILRRFRDWLPGSGLHIAPDQIDSVIFVHDVSPVAPNEAQRRGSPLCDNARGLLTRTALRAGIRRLRGGDYVPAVGTKNSAQAWSLLERLAPGHVDVLRERMQDRAAGFVTGPAIRDLSRFGCRGRVELIDHHGTLAVRKTFRPGRERFLHRELEVIQTLGPICPEIPRLLEYGANYFIIEYIDEDEQLRLPDPPALLPLSQVRQLAAFVCKAIANGWDPIDLKPRSNAIYTARGIKVIDYEFWRRCDPSMPYKDSYCLAGIPVEYEGDRPWGRLFGMEPYPAKWKRITGLDVESFLYDQAWLQAIKRLPWSVRAHALHAALTVGKPLARILPMPNALRRLALKARG